MKNKRSKSKAKKKRNKQKDEIRKRCAQTTHTQYPLYVIRTYKTAAIAVQDTTQHSYIVNIYYIFEFFSQQKKKFFFHVIFYVSVYPMQCHANYCYCCCCCCSIFLLLIMARRHHIFPILFLFHFLSFSFHHHHFSFFPRCCPMPLQFARFMFFFIHSL